MRVLGWNHCGAWLLGVSLLLAGAPATAQQTQSWYTVEAIVFDRGVRAQDAGELWPALDSLPPIDDATPLLPSFGADEVLAHIPFRLLGGADYRLNGIASALRSAPRYNVLRHVAWRQPGLDSQQAVAVRLQPRGSEALLTDSLLRGAAGTEPDVDGVLRLVVSRFLHIEADLVYYRPIVASDAELGHALETFRLHESRRMRSREVHYFDHPLFGVIVTVTPYTPPAPPAR